MVRLGIALLAFLCAPVESRDELEVIRRKLLQDDGPPECEFSNEGGFYRELTGGVDAPIGRFPYMISIQIELNGIFRHFCGGTLISRELILTAAHCLYIKSSQGGLDLRGSDSLQGNLKSSPKLYAARAPLCRHQDGEGGRIGITSFFISSDYNGGPIGGGDIAVLQTEKPFDYTGPFINYDAQKVDFGDSGLFSALGYGATDVLDLKQSGDINRLIPLQLGFFSYTPDDVCQASLFEFNSLYKLIDAVNMCFGGKEVDTCQGDSGGPMILANDNYGVNPAGDPKLDIQVGITSWGPIVDCFPGELGAPGVYTNVAHYYEWIKSVADQTGAAAGVPPATIPTPTPQGCFDKAPPGNFSCKDQKRFNKCGEDWMLQGGYCKKTCDLCDAVAVARSSFSCFGEPQANYKGVIVKIGTKNIQKSVEDCCISCEKDPDCNVWVYCPKKEGCRNLDEILQFGRCDLKFQKVVAEGGIPHVYYRGNETDFTSGHILANKR